MQRRKANQQHWQMKQLGLSLGRSEEHTSELQSRLHLVCRLLLEKKTPLRDRRWRAMSEAHLRRGRGRSTMRAYTSLRALPPTLCPRHFLLTDLSECSWHVAPSFA